MASGTESLALAVEPKSLLISLVTVIRLFQLTLHVGRTTVHRYRAACDSINSVLIYKAEYVSG